jgi:23S rRNA (cytosine1962-C5)-methyltransferase
MAALKLKRGRAKPLWHGHPWVYSQAVERLEGEAEPGDAVSVVDAEGRFIGRGFYNPRSQIACRMATRSDEPLDAAFVKRRLVEARALRLRLGLPSAETDAYRLVNSEGDGLPGLVVDVYRDLAAVQFTALGMKRLETEVFAALASLLEPRTMVEVASGGFAVVEGFTAVPRVVSGESRASVAFIENGIEFAIEPLAGQKTGAFLDQREQRALIGRLAKGARVLDCYCYLGGFALSALKGGASSAVAVDASPRALASARAAAEKAGLAERLEVVESDVFTYLSGTPEKSFDLVNVDPPKFASSKKDLEAAMKGYRRLNSLAIRAVAVGGLLASSSCSQLVDAAELERLLAAAAVDAERELTIIKVASQGPDHPIPPGFTEGRYLKFVLARVGA